MTLHGFFLNVIEINDLGTLKGSSDGDRCWDFEAHHKNTHPFLGTACDRMLRARRQVGKIAGSHWVCRVARSESATALQNEIDLFFAIVTHGLAITAWIETNHGESR